MRTRIAAATILAFAAAGPNPPAEIKLWNAGANPTDFGVHVWSERSAEEVLACYSTRGNPILIDIEHGGAVDEAGEARPTGGYARLELRAGEPWLVFDWSAVGADQILTKQRRFLSPEYDVDKETKEIVRLVRVSLVADPGTHRARMLATKAREERNMSRIYQLQAALRAAMNSADPRKDIAEIIALLEGDLPSQMAPNTPPQDAPQSTPYAPAKSPAGSAVDPYADLPLPEGWPGRKVTAPLEARSPSAVSQAGVQAAARVGAELDVYMRDQLLETEGHRLNKPLRVFASTQPYKVVKAIIDSQPAGAASRARAGASRGRGHRADGLQGAELAEFNKLVGPEIRREMERFASRVVVTSSRDEDEYGPHLTTDGTLRSRGTGADWLRQEDERVKAGGRR